MAQFASYTDQMAKALPAYIVSWMGEATAYWIFVIYMIQSPIGFLWWLTAFTYNFGAICVTYSVKNLLLLILVPVLYKKNTNYEVEKKLNWIDIIYYTMQIVFWVVSAIFAYDREPTDAKRLDANWLVRYARWTKYIYLLPVVKILVDVVLIVVAYVTKQIASKTATAAGAIVWMDFQYLFVYLYISQKTTAFKNFFSLFVWIYMASILAVLGAICILAGVVMSLVAGQKMALQAALMITAALMYILFFVWENIIGAKDGMPKNQDVKYILLVAVILYTLFNSGMTFIFWKGMTIVGAQATM